MRGKGPPRPLPLRSVTSAPRLEGEPFLRLLATYRPKHITRDRWETEIREFVVGQVARLAVGHKVALPILRRLTYLASWCLDEQIPLDVERVLDPDTVERYCAEGLLHYKSAAASTVRWDLRRLGRSLTTAAPWEPPPASYSRAKLPPPYSEAELRCIERDVKRQATPARRHAARAIVALGLGVGLNGKWNSLIRGTDVQAIEDLVMVSVPPPMPRLVVVRDQFAARLLEIADVAGTAPLVGRDIGGKNTASHLGAEIVIDQGRLPLVPGRFRANWLVAHMQAGTQLPIFLKAAGLQGFGSLGDLLRFVRPLPEAEARRQLKDA
jgi:hypothetical protein